MLLCLQEEWLAHSGRWFGFRVRSAQAGRSGTTSYFKCSRCQLMLTGPTMGRYRRT
ncbi:hypothetical protein BD309DRAFT_854895 [Dichomitus squalens]|uniref:Uncharacterized protein n=1 Tax=Dichomitus squalens TaxID=114155 RepID=A0A4Q9QE07_9APHY|nr:hypothetical protein BD309DRAFT_854895 [Dichomitus squalens]TBU66062.1 hypothetical protein BD310DRAFT_804265 [Dichomitus squalens]